MIRIISRKANTFNIGLYFRLFLSLLLLLSPLPSFISFGFHPDYKLPVHEAWSQEAESSTSCNECCLDQESEEEEETTSDPDDEGVVTVKLVYEEQTSTEEESTTTAAEPKEVCKPSGILGNLECKVTHEMEQADKGGGETTTETTPAVEIVNKAAFTLGIKPALSVDDNEQPSLVTLVLEKENYEADSGFSPETTRKLMIDRSTVYELLDGREIELNAQQIEQLKSNGSLTLSPDEPYGNLKLLSRPPLEVTVLFPVKAPCPEFLVDTIADDTDDLYDREEGCSSVPEIPESMQSAEAIEEYMKEQLNHSCDESPETTVAQSCEDLKPFDLTPRPVPWDELARDLMTARYYISKKRLQDGIRASVDSLGALEKIQNMSCERDTPNSRNFGQSPEGELLDDIECSSLSNLDCIDCDCNRIKEECTEPANYASVIEMAEVAHREREAILQEIDRVEAEYSDFLIESSESIRSSPQEQEYIEYVKKKQQKLTSLKNLVESSNPWVKGKEFNDRYEETLEECESDPNAGEELCDGLRGQFVCEGIKAQAAKTRGVLKEQLTEFNQALDCIEGKSCDMDAEEFRKTVDKTPSFAKLSTPDNATPKEKEKAAYANHFSDLFECRSALEDVDEEINEIVLDMAIGIGLTIATAGMGSWAAGLKATSTGSKAARLATALERTALGLDLADMGRGALNSYNECIDILKKSEQMTSVSERGPPCPNGSDYAGPLLAQEADLCFLKAVALELGTGLLPMVPSGVSRALRKVDDSLQTAARQAAKKASNVVDSHSEAISKVAQARDEYILMRPVNPNSTDLIEGGAATKNMHIKGKSSDWGAQKGYIAREQKYSKMGNPDKEIDPAEIDKYNKKVEKSIEEGIVKPVPLKKDGKDVMIVKDKDGNEHIVLQDDKGGYFDPDTGKSLDPGNFEGPGRNMEVLGDPETGLPITADYDLLGVGSKKPPVEPTIDKDMGAVTPDQVETVGEINKGVKETGYTGGNVVHHGPETGNPYTEGADYPITSYEPNGSIVTISQGPPSDPDRHLKDYMHKLRQEGYDIGPNPKWYEDSKKGHWKKWGKYDPETGWP